jgi:hypothetical protein
MQKLCRQAGAELVIVYTPTKPRVVLPLVRDKLPADKVRAFAALKAKDDLPEAQTFLNNLFDYLDVKEAVLEQWCRENSCPFISLTQKMRDNVARGRQVYFTYNEHFTPIGHQVTADAVHEFCSARQVETAEAP